jgi:hypothetical protein
LKVPLNIGAPSRDEIVLLSRTLIIAASAPIYRS